MTSVIGQTNTARFPTKIVACTFLPSLPRWPDDVRNKYPQYDHYLWHYVNIPYRPGEAQGMIPEGESIIKAFPENLSTTNSTTSDDQARAIALCWVIHLIGDIHQPLHTVSIFTRQFPRGDEGGAIFYILPPNGKTISLHKLWDDLILGDKNGFRKPEIGQPF
jgi:hypothetical protein